MHVVSLSVCARARTHTHDLAPGWHVSTVTVSIAAARLGREGMGSLWATPEVELGEKETVPGDTLHA